MFDRLGIDTSSPGFFDQPRFVEQEQLDPGFLERYAEWVIRRPRDTAYDDMVRRTLPVLAERVEARLQRERCVGACLNVATMLSRSLDRLGIWSVVLRGSLTIEANYGGAFEPAHYPVFDTIDHPEGITGHAWLCVPPFAVVDITARHQRLQAEDEPLFALVPRTVLAEAPDIVSPRVEDCICANAIVDFMHQEGRLDPRLHYRLLPGLRTLGPLFPAVRVRAELVSLRYVACAVTASDLPLEECGPLGLEGLLPRDVWDQEIRPAFLSSSGLC